MRSGTQVKTSQVSPQQYIDLFSPMLAMGQEILFVGMSSGISGSYHSAEIAAQQLKEVFPDARIRLVDTLSASLGEGLLVLEAADCRDRGMTLDEALIEVEKYLDEAVMAGMNEVCIVHGKGTGALRAGIQRHLKSYPHVKSFRLGQYGEGESGVTIVTLN